VAERALTKNFLIRYSKHKGKKSFFKPVLYFLSGKLIETCGLDFFRSFFPLSVAIFFFKKGFPRQSGLRRSRAFSPVSKKEIVVS